MKLTFKKLSEKAVIPSRATAGSAGMDICACLDEQADNLAGFIGSNAARYAENDFLSFQHLKPQIFCASRKRMRVSTCLVL